MAGALFLFLVGYFYRDRVIDGLYKMSAVRARGRSKKKGSKRKCFGEKPEVIS